MKLHSGILMLILLLFSTMYSYASDMKAFARSCFKPDTLIKESDSLKIGKPGLNKLEFERDLRSDSSFINLSFFSKNSSGQWKIEQSITFPANPDIIPDIQFSDFNNDGFQDMTYQSQLAGNGSNDIRKLFIYNPAEDRLHEISNAEQYPNLEYNPKLNCLTAQLIYGGSATIFLRLHQSVLVEFAVIESMDKLRRVYKVNESGVKQLIREDKISTNEVFTRYSGFNPLQ